MAQRLGASQSSLNLRASAGYSQRRIPHSASSVSLLLPQSTSLQSLGHASRRRSSGTWTASTGDFGLLTAADEVEDRDVFVNEYNRLAKKHGLRQLAGEDFDACQRDDVSRCPEKRGWISRLLRPSPNRYVHIPTVQPPLSPHLRHKRSVSEVSHLIHCRRDIPDIIEITDLVRLSGKSMLYLPQEYSPCSLILPTCIRATAQYLAQHAETKGLFRVSGSAKVTNALFDYYCYMDSGQAMIAGTVRCATLPLHIQYSVHDVASTFKRILSVLPGGILGSLRLFDAFVAIHSQMNGEPEYPRTKQTKVRARLIALAIGTVRSQYRREAICAVFGLLSLIGRVAEIAPREDEDSRPLPTTDLMGYHALGIIFGPLLVGDLLQKYTMKVAAPNSGMVLFPLSPSRFRRDRRESLQTSARTSAPPIIDKVLVANEITRMLIANWRDIVRQMRSLGTHRRKETPSWMQLPTASACKVNTPNQSDEDDDATQTSLQRQGHYESKKASDTLRSPKPKVVKRGPSRRLQTKTSIAALTPTKEESMGDGDDDSIANAANSGSQDSQQDRSSMPDLVNPESVPPRTSSKKLASLDGKDRFAMVRSSLSQDDPSKSSSCYDNSGPEETSGQKQAQKEHGQSDRNSFSTEIGIRVVQASPVDEPRTDIRRSEPRKGISNSIEATSPRVSQDRSIQCELVPERGCRESIEITPERFYPSRQWPSLTQQAVSHRTSLSPPTDGPDPAHIHGPRLTRSYDNLTSEVAKKPQSPTDSVKSRDLSKRESVKAMAAKYETHTSELGSPSAGSDKMKSRTRSRLHMRDGQPQPGPAWTQCLEPVLDLSQTQIGRNGIRISHICLDDEEKEKWADAQEPSIERHDGASVNGRLSDCCLSPSPDRTSIKMRPGFDADNGPNEGRGLTLSSAGSDRPPTPNLLSLARPASSPSTIRETETAPITDVFSLAGGPHAGSAAVLYSRIRELQRQLDNSADEAAHLRRQLEKQPDSEVTAGDERLRKAERDAAEWKNRAEAAETRLKVFEKCTEKLAEIRDSMAEGRGVHNVGKGKCLPPQVSRALEALSLLPQQDIRSDGCEAFDASSLVIPNSPSSIDSLSATQDGALDSPQVSCHSAENCEGSVLEQHETMQQRQDYDQFWAVADELLQRNRDGTA